MLDWSMENRLRVRYDGRYEGLAGLEDARSYTIVSHIIINGQDLFKFSFTGAKNLLNALKGAI